MSSKNTELSLIACAGNKRRALGLFKMLWPEMDVRLGKLDIGRALRFGVCQQYETACSVRQIREINKRTSSLKEMFSLEWKEERT